jgi:hypothetical protein
LEDSQFSTTSRSYWQEFANDDPSFGNYPLWVVWVNPGAPRLPAGWTNWNFQQWHWETVDHSHASAVSLVQEIKASI